jgi:hypothetical protein
VQAKTFFLKVKKIHYRTTPAGYVSCLLELSEGLTIVTGKDKSITYEVLKLEKPSDLVKFNINEGQLLLVNFGLDSSKNIRYEIKGSKIALRPAKFSPTCHVCKSPLDISADIAKCTGVTCKAKSSTTILNLFNVPKKRTSAENKLFYDYLLKFPTYDSFTHIHLVEDYVTVLRSLGNLNIEGRYSLVAKAYSPSVYEFELWLIEAVKTKFFEDNLRDFWSIISFPSAEEVDTLLDHLQSINPTDEGFSNKLYALPFPDEVKDSIIEHNHLIRRLFTHLTQ